MNKKNYISDNTRLMIRSKWEQKEAEKSMSNHLTVIHKAYIPHNYYLGYARIHVRLPDKKSYPRGITFKARPNADFTLMGKSRCQARHNRD